MAPQHRVRRRPLVGCWIISSAHTTQVFKFILRQGFDAIFLLLFSRSPAKKRASTMSYENFLELSMKFGWSDKTVDKLRECHRR